MHSYLDDGPAMQFNHYGGYLGWAALELHIVEDLLGARLAHCYGGPRARTRRTARSSGSRSTTCATATRSARWSTATPSSTGRTASATSAVLTTSVMIDVATQLRRPTGHALNPVPLSEAERIPDADEILEVHLMARELEIEVRRGAPLLDWAWAERRAAEAVAYARAFRDGALAHFADAGADPGDAGALLLALRRTTPAALERAIRIPASRELLELETWKHGVVATVAERARRSLPRLDGRRIVLAALEVHDVVRDALARELPQAGAQVIVLPSSISPEQLARAAADEDADTVIVATYNGGALTLGKALMRTLPADVTVIFGGVLNEDDGGPLPVDARPGLEALGIRCVGEIEQLGAALA